MKDCQVKERGDVQRLRPSLRKTKRLVRSKEGAPRQEKQREKGRRWWRRKEGRR
jgi:hypothetical protein